MKLGQKIVGRLVKGYRAYSREQMFVPTATATPSDGSPLVQPVQLRFGKMGAIEQSVALKIVPEIVGGEMVGGRGGKKTRLEVRLAEAFELPSLTQKFKPGKFETTEEKKSLRLAYPLIPRQPKKGEPIYAYTKISWEQKASRYLYEVNEPPLSEKSRGIMRKIKELLEQRIDVDF